MNSKMGSKFKPVTHVLFELDGLLLNTEDYYTIACQKLAHRYGKEFNFPLKVKVMGQNNRDCSEEIIKELKLPITSEEYSDQMDEDLKEFFPQAHLMPGVEKLIRHLHEHEIPMGLVTSSREEFYDMKIQKHKELFSMMMHKTFGSSESRVERGKPYSDLFLVAASKFPDKPSPEKCLVFEDSVNGVKAAISAGMQVVIVPDPHLNKTLAEDATLTLNSLAEFKPEDFGLPPYN